MRALPLFLQDLARLDLNHPGSSQAVPLTKDCLHLLSIEAELCRFCMPELEASTRQQEVDGLGTACL